ncbi:agamous-like MADS-box protein AGL6 [Curcuma longa]|uniref:agamous-like MADS-box protein AGL6 n=1 Tax=Curcuma longa TaxID=136217 RepID=UPI003D9DFB26
MGAATKKTTRGRQKIEMKAIEKEAARQVCFSKRRAGVFKKASELSVLCGAEIAVLAFSPSGKPFSYGHPSVESIFGRFFGGSAVASPAPPPRHPLAAVLVQALGRQEKELQERLEAGRRRKAALEEALRGPQWGPVGDLLGADVEELGLPELDLLQSALEWVRAEAVSRARQVAVEALLQAPTGEASGSGFAVSSAPAAVPAPAPGLVDFRV